MTRFFVATEQTEQEEKQLEVFLEVGTEEDQVAVMVRDHNGKSWYVAFFRAEGILRLACCLSPDIGLQLDDEGAIVVEDNRG